MAMAFLHSFAGANPIPFPQIRRGAVGGNIFEQSAASEKLRISKCGFAAR
jgi:hypothetical protein